MRTTLATICGKEYWLAFSAQSQIALEALKRRENYTPADYSAETIFLMLDEELRAGYRWAQLTGAQPQNKPPRREDLADLIDIYEVQELLPTIMDVMTGERNVVAKPPKKEQAGGLGDLPAR